MPGAVDPIPAPASAPGTSVKPAKAHPSNVKAGAAGATAREDLNAAWSARRTAASQYRANLINRFPKLRRANLRLNVRNLSIPGQWEESILTGSGRLSWNAELRDGTGIQLDDFDQDGFVVDTKMRGIMEGREIPSAREPDVVNQIGGDRAPKTYPKLSMEESTKLRKQIRFAEENGLPGVKWLTNSPELKEEVERYVAHILTDREQELFSIEEVNRF